MLPGGRVFYSQSASLWLNVLTSSVKLFPLYQKLRYRDIYPQWAPNRNRTLKRSTLISSFALCFQNPKSSVESVIRNTLKDTAHNDLQRKWVTLTITMPSIIIHYHFLIATQTSCVSLHLGTATEIFLWSVCFAMLGFCCFAGKTVQVVCLLAKSIHLGR